MQFVSCRSGYSAPDHRRRTEGYTSGTRPHRRGTGRGGHVAFNPDFFHYPALSFYIHFIGLRLRFLAGSVTGTYESLDAFRLAMNPLMIGSAQGVNVYVILTFF